MGMVPVNSIHSSAYNFTCARDPIEIICLNCYSVLYILRYCPKLWLILDISIKTVDREEKKRMPNSIKIYLMAKTETKVKTKIKMRDKLKLDIFLFRSLDFFLSFLLLLSNEITLGDFFLFRFKCGKSTLLSC